jgi:DNA-binding winged helix-turn-helix (wHTH) protein
VLYVFEDYVFDTARRELRRGDTLLPVEPQIFDLLAHLIANRDRVVSKEDLLAAVWQKRIVSESTLSSSINAARTVLGDSGEQQRLIRTLPRKGFRFVGEVTEAPAAPLTDAAASTGEPALAPSDERGSQHEPLEPSAVGPAPVVHSRRLALTSRKTILFAGGAGLLALAATLVFLWLALDPARRAPSPASGPTFDASIVPLVDDEARKSLASYPNRPDFKALAITGEGMAVADGEPDAEAARQDALRRCTAKTKRQCRLYAVGVEVVWSGEALPLPAPDDLRVEPLGIPLVPEEIPTLDRERRDRIARMHMKAPNHRALAMTARGAWTIASRATRAEAVRIAVERCSEYWQRPCLILAVDGLLTMQIPKSRQAIGMFVPSRDAELSGDDKERVGQIYRGAEWRALARGKNGRWHAVAGAPSEEAAVAGALQACAQADPECRLHAIGNFRVLAE